MTPLEMLHTPLMSQQEIEYILNDLRTQFLSRQCQSHEITIAENYEFRTEFDMYLIANSIGVLVTYEPRSLTYRYCFDTYDGYCQALKFNLDTTHEDIFEGYSEDLCENENEQAMFDAAYAYGWE